MRKMPEFKFSRFSKLPNIDILWCNDSIECDAILNEMQKKTIPNHRINRHNGNIECRVWNRTIKIVPDLSFSFFSIQFDGFSLLLPFNRFGKKKKNSCVISPWIWVVKANRAKWRHTIVIPSGHQSFTILNLTIITYGRWNAANCAKF